MTKKAIVFTLLMLLSAPALMAADLYGYLADKSGKPLIAKVELRDTSAKLVAGPVTSDAKGYYSFKEIKPGAYEIMVGGKSVGTIFVGPGETRRDLRLN